jgi:hypothetical protein
MAIEAKRGCGYRKVGGLYLIGGKLSAQCCKLPVMLNVCPTCGGGIKQTRGFTWIDPRPFFGGTCIDVRRFAPCPASPVDGSGLGERAGLLWIGERFYPTPQHFLAEGQSLGVCRRIAAIPRELELGKTWILLAHPKSGTKTVITCKIDDEIAAEFDVDPNRANDPGVDAAARFQNRNPACLVSVETRQCPAIFSMFVPTRIEKIVTESEAADVEAMAALEKRGITPVAVPDHDPDHQGSVYDKDDDDQPPLRTRQDVPFGPSHLPITPTAT